MDIFGFETQGAAYDKFRPRYPPTFIESSLIRIAKKNRYLDIATGTGQLLFAIAPYFTHSRGIDISKNMIQNAIKNVPAFSAVYPNSQLQIDVCDVSKYDQNIKYNLITVGQALHFFPIQPTLHKIKSLLQTHGLFVTFAYIIKQIVSTNPLENKHFNAFYGKVKPLFTFDRDDLHTYYSDNQKYPFEKVFGKVEREVTSVQLHMNKQEYLNYLKTMSGYNLYLTKFEDDPLKQLQKVCADEVICVLDYFKITCSDPQ